VGLFEIGVYWKILGVVMTVFGIGYLFAASWPINCYTRTIGKICESTILPAHFSFLGLAILATGMFFILESYAVNHKYYNHSRLMKIGLIIAMLIVVFYAWTGGMSGYLLP
ncbi:MAG: hypothetical protein NTY48_01195, partial [Candidatus Diapherotrites archaeon]|nr:hypothetical protein [Candidatus Diapherotrites archaeon]